jgi:hypothetical protein
MEYFEPIINNFCEIYNISQDEMFDDNISENFLDEKYNNNLNIKENEYNLKKYLKDIFLDEIETKLKQVIITKLKKNDLLKYLNTGKLIRNKLYVSDSIHYTDIQDFKYYHFNYLIEPNSYVVKSKIIYNIEQFKQYYLNYFIKHDININELFKISKNPSKNYVKFQYLLCIISIMRQKCNFQDYGFCNYFISFL